MICPPTSAECSSQTGRRHRSHSRYTQVSLSWGIGLEIGCNRALQPPTLHLTNGIRDYLRTLSTQVNARRRAANGADAVIGMRYDATEFAQGVTEVLAYGTAVVIEPPPPR